MGKERWVRWKRGGWRGSRGEVAEEGKTEEKGERVMRKDGGR